MGVVGRCGRGWSGGGRGILRRGRQFSLSIVDRWPGGRRGWMEWVFEPWLRLGWARTVNLSWSLRCVGVGGLEVGGIGLWSLKCVCVEDLEVCSCARFSRFLWDPGWTSRVYGVAWQMTVFGRSRLVKSIVETVVGSCLSWMAHNGEDNAFYGQKWYFGSMLRVLSMAKVNYILE